MSQNRDMGHPKLWLHGAAGGTEAKLHGLCRTMRVAIAVEFGVATVEVFVECEEIRVAERERGEGNVDLEGLALIAHGESGGEGDVG